MHKTIIRNGLKAANLTEKVQRPSVEDNSTVIISKSLDGKSFSLCGALPGEIKENSLGFSVVLPRRAGIVRASLHFKADGGEYIRYEMENTGDFTQDIYTVKLPERLPVGLYYYYFSFFAGDMTLSTDSVNNVDFTLSEKEENIPFKLLVYGEDFKTPDWFCGNVMYQIFVDRFYKGSKNVPVSKTATVNDDWENGIMQYAEYPGGFVANNMFFGGTLFGVCEKLDYLEELGVGCIYLCPIFKAYSNHKYDTGDYMTVDEMFGGEEALKKLLSEAKKRKIRVVLDGVFNHTGDDSLYFNKYGRYESLGAAQSKNSPYRNWYHFEPDGSYKSWWGIEVLPKLNLANEECRNYFLGTDGVLDKYFSMGVGGIRLDVADELPGEFLNMLRAKVKEKNPCAIIIGEVWENAADKIAYGERREYFRGGQLDSVMNYPLKNAIIEFVKKGDSEILQNTLCELYSSYPECCRNVLMNILGTHDTERIISTLSTVNTENLTNAQLSTLKMTKEEKDNAKRKLMLVSIIQFTVFGTPCIFYGDEAGTEGYRDPFCRKPFPWHNIDTELLSHYKRLGAIRKEEKVLKNGDFRLTLVKDGVIAYKRFNKKDEILVVANSKEKPFEYPVEAEYRDMLTGETFKNNIRLEKVSARILRRQGV